MNYYDKREEDLKKAMETDLARIEKVDMNDIYKKIYMAGWQEGCHSTYEELRLREIALSKMFEEKDQTGNKEK